MHRHLQGRLIPWASLLTVLAVVALLIGVNAPAAAQGGGRPQLRRALLATVRVAVPIDGEEDSYSTGSGTILNADGTILTNYHVVGDVDKGELYNKDGVAFIAINPTNLKGLPTWQYEAEVVRADQELDLALLKITGFMESKDPLPQALGLVTMDVADSDALNIGDELDVIGFPGIGGDTVTYTEGTVAGFLDEDRNGIFEWIKTDAEVNHGNSGGLAVNAEGLMVGVPTAGVSDSEAAGKISLIRPINMAMPLVKLSAPVQASTCRSTDKHPKGATIDNLVFAELVDQNDNPEGVGSSFDSGLKAVYAVFDFDRFKNGREFKFTWYLDGEQLFEDTADWDAGARGSYWVNVFNDEVLPDGLYTLELQYDDVLLACGSFALGQGTGTSTATAKIGPLTFSSGQEDDQPIDEGTQFSSGTEEIFAFFDYSGMTDGAELRQVWTIDGEDGLDTTDAWNAGATGSYWISINSSDGLPDGEYELELSVDGKVAQTGQFSIGGGDQPVADEGVTVTGTVVDANRKSRSIEEAMVIFLYPGTDIDEWASTQDQDQVFSTGITDADGWFQLSEPAMPGETYPVIVLAEGYRPVAEQAFTIPEDATSPYELDITMEQE